MAIHVGVTRDAFHRKIAGEVGRVTSSGARYWNVVYPAWVGAPFCQAGLQWGLRALGASMIPAALPFYVPSLEAYARGRNAWVSRYGAARPGDWVIYDFTGAGYGGHVEYVERYNSNGTITTIGFNTSSGNSGSQTNGRGVWRRVRNLANVRGFVRVTYRDAPTRKTTSASRSTATRSSSTRIRTLSYGSKGADVAVLQRGLNRHFPAYARLAVDRSFGPATRKAVREFQRRSGLKVDGYVGPATRKELAKYGIRWW